MTRQCRSKLPPEAVKRYTLISKIISSRGLLYSTTSSVPLEKENAVLKQGLGNL